MQPLEMHPDDRPQFTFGGKEEPICECCKKREAEFDFHDKELCENCFDEEVNETMTIEWIENSDYNRYLIINK